MEFGIAGLQENGGMSIASEESIRLGVHWHLSAYEIFHSGNALVLYENTDLLTAI
jgi:hypothetical protein